MIIKSIRESESPENDISILLQRLHKEGPRVSDILEKLSFYKEFHNEIFIKFEEKIISALGIYYKLDKPSDLYSFLMSGFGKHNEKLYGKKLTPVQASIRNATETKKYTSISAPTSAGKSFSIRELIASSTGDAVIVVPSRALIAEYVGSMQRRFSEDKSVMISSFADHVFKGRELRRIFILTPERTKDLYKLKQLLNIEIFFFDEAQITDEKKRGLIFDVMIRRIKRNFPNSKLIFAHPFINNPEAHFNKHGIDRNQCFSKAYPFGTVGKICIFKHDNQKSYYFSPYTENGHKINNCVEFDGSFSEFALNGKNSILVYVSKNSIKKGDFLTGFDEYINSLPPTSSLGGLKIIEEIQHILGADNSTHKSTMIELLRKGVVIHHGSIPLEVRFLIESFIRGGHATICFATSTLAQGINMPFDIVWIENNRLIGTEEERALSFKNLIGRSGRMTDEIKFDYGYVYTNNPKLFSQRINSTISLKETSLIETCDPSEDEDDRELLEAIKDDTLDDEKNVPLSKVERLSGLESISNAKLFLDILYSSDSIKESIGGIQNELKRSVARNSLKRIFEISLDRDLMRGEENVFNNAVSILFHMFQQRSFREIVGIRFSYISDRDKMNNGFAQFSQPAEKLPNIDRTHAFGLYEANTPSSKVSYDAVVYDTYDYMDQVISFSLSDIFVAAFQIYKDHNEDPRADDVIKLFRYGTNDPYHILLMRYGFPPDLVGEIEKYIANIDEHEIRFKENVKQAPSEIQELTDWYMPD
ncbi:DEAD/DEAH box helicase [Marinimicrobium agarilyticum]|uniref:DEAD/DEAH box helicase n=1 Tax=Marinimicrobium agarilyticum TaxID=306546 RepID=UPI00041DD5B3|nr:DEAD/DEAH box helicase [Marinimicrobium agarilyticum]